MKRTTHALKTLFVLATVFVCSSSFAPARAADRTPKEIADAVWKKTFAAKNDAQRMTLAEQIHAALNKTTFPAREDGLFYAALAALHVQESATRLSALTFLVHARTSWPGLGDAKETPAIWAAFRKSFDDAQVMDDTVLTGAAVALAGSTLAEAEDTAFHFYNGLALYQSKRYPEALSQFQKVSVTVEHYRRAKFLEALIHVELDHPAEAREALQIVVSMDPSDAEKSSPLPSKSIARLRELGVLNLARLTYEGGDFLASLAYYRTLMQDSTSFHTSLSEQGWAFFMAGYPNRALGAQYAATSPFFADKFSPDGYFFNAVLRYWMCDFEGARTGLAKFVAHTRDEGDELRKRTASLQSFSEAERMFRYAKVYDDAKGGVSSRNVGLGPKTLATLLSQDAPRDAHNALTGITKRRLAMTKAVAKRQGGDRILKAVTALERELKIALGRRVSASLGSLAADFDKSLGQARILYLEILTAKKDELLGKERSVKGQEFVGNEKAFEEAFEASAAQKWAQDKSEFWFDELGHYVFQQESKCAAGVQDDKK